MLLKICYTCLTIALAGGSVPTITEAIAKDAETIANNLLRRADSVSSDMPAIASSAREVAEELQRIVIEARTTNSTNPEVLRKLFIEEQDLTMRANNLLN
jgi:hypothetical protein